MLFLLVTRGFQMPSDPTFYLSWFGLTFLTVVRVTLFIIGMTKTRFLAANAFSSLAFVTTIFYAKIFLHEPLSPLSAVAVFAGLAGAILFFDWQDVTKKDLRSNVGLLLIAFSVFLSPLESILYKVSTLHADSYQQLLTGRIVMDFLYYSVFFFLLYFFWHRRSPLPKLAAFAVSLPAILFTLGSVTFNLIDSYLFFKLPVSLLTILENISIPAGYFIAHIKYKERISPRYIFGAILIVFGVVLFVKAGYAVE